MDAPQITPTPQQETDMLTLNLEGDGPKKPKRKWPVITAAIIAAVAVAAVILVFILKNLNNTPDSQKVITIVDVERQAADSMEWSGLAYDGPVGMSTDISFDVNDVALKLIKNQLPDLAFLEELDGMAVNTVFESNNGMARFAIDLKVDEQTEFPIEIILDYKTRCAYIASELFADNYLKFELSSLQESDSDMEMIQFILEAVLNSEMADQYFDAFLELMSARETKTEIVTVNGVSQECTVYSAHISSQDIYELFAGFLEELKESNSAYEDMIDSVMELVEDNLKTDPQTLYWDVYTDSDGKIIGRDVHTDEEKLFSYMIVKDGEDLGATFSVADFAVQGNATVEDGLLDGKFFVSMEQEDYLKITAKDFDLDGMNDGVLNGSIELEPTDALLAELFDTQLSIPVSITIDFEGTADSQTIELSLMEMITLSVDLTDFEPGEITVPEGNEINGEDPDALSRLLGLVDLDVAV